MLLLASVCEPCIDLVLDGQDLIFEFLHLGGGGGVTARGDFRPTSSAATPAIARGARFPSAGRVCTGFASVGLLTASVISVGFGRLATHPLRTLPGNSPQLVVGQEFWYL